MPYYNKNYQNLPKKPVKTFHDLEVYQKALETAVFIVNFIVPSPSVPLPTLPGLMAQVPMGQKTQRRKGTMLNDGQLRQRDAQENIIKNLTDCALHLPSLIAAAHSWRFGSQKECLILLERAMLGCNKIVVYLDLARDICATGISAEQFNELAEKYFYLRRKILNLQRSWQKYINPNQTLNPKL